MNDVKAESHEEAVDKGLAYETPELVDRGDVSRLTQTSTINPGADGVYS